MNRSVISWCILLVAFGVTVSLSWSAPWILGRENQVIDRFVNEGLLDVLGVILAITLASAANLHLEFNKIEDAFRCEILRRARAKVKETAYSLIVAFCAAVVLLIAKPVVGSSEVGGAFANGIGIIIVLFNILALADLTGLVFRMTPIYKIGAPPAVPEPEEPGAPGHVAPPPPRIRPVARPRAVRVRRSRRGGRRGA